LHIRLTKTRPQQPNAIVYLNRTVKSHSPLIGNLSVVLEVYIRGCDLGVEGEEH
jgi:hypothetical protein